MSLIPIKQTFKVKTVSKNPEGKEEIKYEEKQQTSFSHSSWLQDSNREKISQIQESLQYRVRSAGVAVGIATLLGFVHVPFLNKLPLAYKAGGVVGAAAVAYFAADFVLKKVALKQITKIVSENDLIPIWNSKDRVIEKDNVYFFLDDDKGFRPNILYHGISEKQIDSMLPDGVHGNKKYQKESYLEKYNEFMDNKDHNLTNSLLEELGFSLRAKRLGNGHH